MRVLHLEHRHAVDVLRLQAGVLERELDGFDRRVADGAADVLGEREVPDADDGDAVLDTAEQVGVVGHAWPGGTIGRRRLQTSGRDLGFRLTPPGCAH